MAPPVPVFARDLQPFLASPDAAPVSSSPERANWTDPDKREEMVCQIMENGVPEEQAAEAAADLLVCNKSRDTSSCRVHD